jgi:hypothetical protein
MVGSYPQNTQFVWYYQFPDPWGYGRAWTYTWSAANNLYGFLCVNGHMIIKATINAYQGAVPPQSIYYLGMRPGDVIFYDWVWNGVNAWDHCSLQVVEGYDPNSWPSGTLIDQHSPARIHTIWHGRPYNNYAWAARYQLCHIYPN